MDTGAINERLRRWITDNDTELESSISNLSPYDAVCKICDRYQIEKPSPNDEVYEDTTRVYNEIAAMGKNNHG